MSTPHAEHLTAALTALPADTRHHFAVAAANVRDAEAAEGKAARAEVWSAFACYVAAVETEIAVARRAFEVEMTAALAEPDA